MTNYKEKFMDSWNKSGGLITKSVAGKILNVDRSAMSRTNKISKIKIDNDEFVPLTDILKCEIKPRKKRKQSGGLRTP